jgi:hypothetical protein
MGKNKKPRSSFQPRMEKVPRAADLAEKIGTTPFCWRVTDLDWEGPWGWKHVPVDLVLGTIIPKLHDYESMTWAAVEGPTGCHFVEVEALSPVAQARLREIEKDEQGQLFSVRIMGKLRVWGIRDLAILRVLWCDPEHEVCPATKRRT